MTYNPENIRLQTQSITQLLDDTEILINLLTGFFILNINDFDINPDECVLIQMYIASLTVMIPELRSHIRLIEKGVYSTLDLTVKTIERMEKYVCKTKNQFENIMNGFYLQYIIS